MLRKDKKKSVVKQMIFLFNDCMIIGTPATKVDISSIQIIDMITSLLIHIIF